MGRVFLAKILPSVDIYFAEFALFAKNGSLVQHLLCVFLELTAAIHIANLLCGCGTGAVSSTILRWALLSAGVLLVNYHTLSTHGVLLGRGAEALIATTLASTSTVLFLHTRLLANHVHHRVLERLLGLAQTVLLPGVVEDAMVEAVPLHAAFEVVEALAIVGLLLELEGTAVLHVLAELARVTATQLF